MVRPLVCPSVVSSLLRPRELNLLGAFQEFQVVLGCCGSFRVVAGAQADLPGGQLGAAFRAFSEAQRVRPDGLACRLRGWVEQRPENRSGGASGLLAPARRLGAGCGFAASSSALHVCRCVRRVVSATAEAN